MKKHIFKTVVGATIFASSFMFSAQATNWKTEKVKIFGNCELCEQAIEAAGTQQKFAKVDWSKETKYAEIKFDSQKTSLDEVLKRIALAGYDNDSYLAPDQVYAKLPACCRYERTNKMPMMNPSTHAEGPSENTTDMHAHQGENISGTTIETQKQNELKPVFDAYFMLKDALVKSDGKVAAKTAKDLNNKVMAVKMGNLSENEHMVWMKVLNSLKSNSEKISKTQNIEVQRKIFMGLSASMYELGKVAKLGQPVYYQYCPMYNDGKGSNWLSKENIVKNPYYGAQMLSCGKVVETLK